MTTIPLDRARPFPGTRVGTLTAMAASLLLPVGAQAASPFARADIFYELNATAGDVGVHVSVDAPGWRSLRIRSPTGALFAEIEPQSGFKKIGLSELFFEGSEPPLDEVSFRRFRSLFPAGNYSFTGRDGDAGELLSTDALTTDLPCPVAVTSPDASVLAERLVVRWAPAPGVYDPDRRQCDARRDVVLVGYEVIVEAKDEAAGTTRHLDVEVGPGTTALPIPEAFLEESEDLPGITFALEVIAIEESGNKTITEQSFKLR